MKLIFSCNHVEFVDMTPPVFRAFLTFIYTDDLSKLALAQYDKDILIAVANYQVPRLISLCTQFILATISPNVAADFLLLSAKLDLVDFSSQVEDYIAMNFSDLSTSDPSYKLLSASQCRHLLEKSSVHAFNGTESLQKLPLSSLPPIHHRTQVKSSGKQCNESVRMKSIMRGSSEKESVSGTKEEFKESFPNPNAEDVCQ